MEITATPLKDVYLITVKRFGDARGWFSEVFRESVFREATGRDLSFVQVNESFSEGNILRGIHFQNPHPQGKLVRVSRGEVFDVAVDLRKGSATYGKWYGVELSDENKKQFLIPKGFAHGFLVRSDTAEFCYKCDDFYHPDDEGGLAWNDPAIGVDWGILGSYMGNAAAAGYTLPDGTPVDLSEKDEKWLPLGQTFSF